MSGLDGPSEIVLPVFKSISAIYMYAYSHICSFYTYIFFKYNSNRLAQQEMQWSDYVTDMSLFFSLFFFFICDKKVWSFGPYTTKEWQVSLPADGGCGLWQPLPLEKDRHSKKKSWPSRVEASSCPELSLPSKKFCLSIFFLFFFNPFCWFLKQFFKKFSQRRVQYYMISI